jgi:hypothetical protein
VSKEKESCPTPPRCLPSDKRPLPEEHCSRPSVHWKEQPHPPNSSHKPVKPHFIPFQNRRTTLDRGTTSITHQKRQPKNHGPGHTEFGSPEALNPDKVTSEDTLHHATGPQPSQQDARNLTPRHIADPTVGHNSLTPDWESADNEPTTSGPTIVLNLFKLFTSGDPDRIEVSPWTNARRPSQQVADKIGEARPGYPLPYKGPSKAQPTHTFTIHSYWLFHTLYFLVLKHQILGLYTITTKNTRINFNYAQYFEKPSTHTCTYSKLCAGIINTITRTQKQVNEPSLQVRLTHRCLQHSTCYMPSRHLPSIGLRNHTCNVSRARRSNGSDEPGQAI